MSVFGPFPVRGCVYDSGPLPYEGYADFLGFPVYKVKRDPSRSWMEEGTEEERFAQNLVGEREERAGVQKEKTANEADGERTGRFCKRQFRPR